MIYLKKFNESSGWETNLDKISRILESQDCKFDIDTDGTVNVENNVYLDMILLEGDYPEGRIPFKFGNVGCDFICYDCKLTSLEGSPREVGGGLWANINLLTDLKGGPEYVNYLVVHDNNLTSLEGIPKNIGIFDLSSKYVPHYPKSYRGLIGLSDNRKLYDPTALRDCGLCDGFRFEVGINAPPFFQIWKLFERENSRKPDEMVPLFLDSLDYNYFKYVDGKPCIIKWKFEEALQETLGISAPDKIKGYKYID